MTTSFWVPGIPKPGGSKRGFYSAKLKRVIITDACKDNKDWKNSVSMNANSHFPNGPLQGPLEVHFEFHIPRPKGHFGKKGVRPSAPQYPAVRPDCTKLIRSTEDALTGIAWDDDSQIVTQLGTKRYSQKAGAQITVTCLTSDTEDAPW